jgi:chorismate dehydratase
LERKWRIGAVSYLNTRPLLYGIEQSGLKPQIELIKAYPAIIAQDLIDGNIDMGLVPVAVIPLLKEAHLVSKYCIGAESAVASVCIFSDVPMDQIEKVYLDYQSRTSVQLAKILLQQFWKKEVNFIKAEEGYIHQINGTSSGVIIGDRALLARSNFKYVYDLAEAWIEHTGLPFVFATWIANKPIPADFIKAFDLANEFGLNHINDVIESITDASSEYDLNTYFTKNISYDFSEQKKKGLALFLKSL